MLCQTSFSKMNPLLRVSTSLDIPKAPVCGSVCEHGAGGLVTRAVLEITTTPILSYVSLAGPQLGQFGEVGVPKWLKNFTTDTAWHFMYSKIAQDTYSAANYWHDPYHETEFREHSVFLPPLTLQGNETYKSHLQKVGHAAFFGSPDDGVISPWYSSVWSFLDNTGRRVPLEEQEVWVNDTLGLRELNSTV